MIVTFLGTGTSHGVPMIACDCPVCTSDDPHNNRTRSSALIEVNGVRLLIDTGPEMRIQALREGITHVDAILFTHAHADHVFGLDDVRRFNDISNGAMPCYGSEQTLTTIRRAFDYVFRPTQIGGGKPKLDLIKVDSPFEAAGVPVIPIPVLHGRIKVFGFRIGNFAYVTDCSQIPEQSMELLSDLDTLVLGVIRHEPHETHLCVNQGIEIAEKLTPHQTYFTHITHRLDHESTNRMLPDNIRLAYDGLRLTI
ncbi:MAG: MBL fold metallo-hydrolase [Armatimonadota bacterium]|nr:MBL fold metallo-hydrolase [bacterium]